MISIRRACSFLLFDTSSYPYKSRRTGQAAHEKRVKEMCEARVRYGYRRVHVLLRREGWLANKLAFDMPRNAVEVGIWSNLYHKGICYKLTAWNGKIRPQESDGPIGLLGPFWQ